MAGKRSPFLVVDFPGPSGAPERLTFTDPTAVLVADRLADVSAVLESADTHAAAGRYVAGFVSYDAAPAFEPAMRVPALSNVRAPLAWFGVFDRPSSMPRESGDAISDPVAWTPATSRRDFDAAIETIRSAIRDGDVYQVNHTLRLRRPWNADDDARALYERLRGAQRASYCAYIDTGAIQIVSVSPELFFAREGRRITTRPMKGTARRGRWTDEDRIARDALLASKKERAENLMIVDLLRNDVGRITRTGSVDVPALLVAERYPTVWQLTSTIVGELRDDVRLPDVFGALFPSGSVTGAPKIAATQFIAQLEHEPRGVYCGAIGLVRPGGDAVFNVAIRSVVIDAEARIAEYGVGGGITYDSVPSREYDEVLAKSAVLDAVPQDFGLIETMRLVDGAIVRRDRHLGRLRDSADYWGLPDPQRGAIEAIDAHAREHPRGMRRLRLELRHDGSVSVTSQALAADAVNATRPIAAGVATAEPVDPADPLLFHKVTHRARFDRARAAFPDADDALMVNTRGEATEFTIGNLVADLDGRRVTPPRDCGLLAGVFRAELLENEIVEEQVLPLDDLRRATAVWRVNSLREWTPVQLRWESLSKAP
jgi:para-aminobenzoate synthetase/4-amino-4-deoxychorismate lyase